MASRSTCACVEGELLVFHDARLERTTNGRGAFGRKTLAHLRALDAGGGRANPHAARSVRRRRRPRLPQHRVKGAAHGPPTAVVVRDLVERGGWRPDQFLVSSFLRRELRLFREADAGRTPLGLLLARPTRLFPQPGAGASARTTIHPPLALHQSRGSSKRRTRTACASLFTRSIEPARACADAQSGVDGVFTDFPNATPSHARSPADSSSPPFAFCSPPAAARCQTTRRPCPRPGAARAHDRLHAQGERSPAVRRAVGVRHPAPVWCDPQRRGGLVALAERHDVSHPGNG